MLKFAYSVILVICISTFPTLIFSQTILNSDTDSSEKIAVFVDQPAAVSKVSTVNSAPSVPQKLICTKKIENDKSMTAVMRWEASKDPDGRVVIYKIYQKFGSKNVLIGSSAVNSCEIIKLNARYSHYFTVCAVDDQGEYSDYSDEAGIDVQNGWRFGLQPVFIYPLGKFAKINKYGYGGLIGLYKKGIFLDNFELGLAPGFITYTVNSKDAGKSFMAPLLIPMNYNLKLASFFSLVPHLSLGMCYAGLEKKNSVTNKMEMHTAFEPLLLAGLTFSLTPGSAFFMNLGADYGIIYEKAGPMMFASGSLEFGGRF